MTVRIITGDCRLELIKLAPRSAHMFMTSPPYYHKRDYGTSRWRGGDRDCDHQPDEDWFTKRQHRSTLSGSGDHQRAAALMQWFRPGGKCRCGATAVDSQIGMEPTPDDYIRGLVEVFDLAWEALRDDGTMWVVIGDGYAGSWGAQGKRMSSSHPIGRNSIANHPKFASRTGSIAGTGLKLKDRMMLPARLAIALQARGWFLRDEIVWHKPNPVPFSGRDRTTPSHEMVYIFSKAPSYHYDIDAIKEPAKYAPGCGWIEEPKGTRNGKRGQKQLRRIDPEQSFRAIRKMRHPRSVWTVTAEAFDGDHFATYPAKLIRPMILAACPKGGLVVDPFFGSGTTGQAAAEIDRNCIGIDLSSKYCAMARKRLRRWL